MDEIVREIDAAELDNLLNLYSHLHDTDDPRPGSRAIEAVWKEIRDMPNFRYFGVFIDHRLVSSCTLSIIPNLTRGCRPYGVIENVVTHKDFRNKGYGSAVLKHALSHAWKRNCYKVTLLTGRKSEAVYRFYESAGFDRNAKQAFIAKPTP